MVYRRKQPFPRAPLTISDKVSVTAMLSAIENYTNHTWGWHIGVCRTTVDCDLWKISQTPEGLNHHRQEGEGENCISADLRCDSLGVAVEEAATILEETLPPVSKASRFNYDILPDLWLRNSDYLQNLDAAITTIEQGLPGWWWGITNYRERVIMTAGLDVTGAANNSWVRLNKLYDGGIGVSSHDLKDEISGFSLLNLADLLVTKIRDQIMRDLFLQSVRVIVGPKRQ